MSNATPSSSLSELADLKEVIARLWKQTESLESSSVSRYEQLHHKVDTWADTNIQLQKTTQTLIEAIVTNSTEFARCAESSQHGKQQHVDLSQQISALEQHICTAKQLLEQISKPIKQKTNLPGLSSDSSSSEPSLAVIQAIERKLSLRFTLTMLIGAFLIALAGGAFGWFINDQTQMRHFDSRAEHALFLKFWHLNSEELLQCINTDQDNCTVDVER
ncbi:MAG: hypothetical protein AAFR31_18935 [Cyanobacteria bacterium J06627_8]